MKITFLGAGSTIFARNVIGDCMCAPSLRESEFALYDIDGARLAESEALLSAINETKGGYGRITTYLGPERRRDALRGASFVINAIQVGGYDPCTITDFEIPKKYGLRQTIADSYGVGGIFRAMRTIPVMADFARDIEAVCPDAWLLNYTNPMGMLTGYMLLHTGVKTVGLCHSVQVCSAGLLKRLGMEDKLEGRKELIAGINHLAWLLELRDRDGNDLYPEIRRRAEEVIRDPACRDRVRLEYVRKLGYYCTESSEHNAEYNPWFIKRDYPELIDRYAIPLDEYPRRCVSQIEGWRAQYREIMGSGRLDHEQSREYAWRIMHAITTGECCQIGGNVLNDGLIGNLPRGACVEVPCLVNARGVQPCRVGDLPTQLAALDSAQTFVQMLAIQAAVSCRREDLYRAVMFDPLASANLSIDDMIAMTDELIEAHGNWLPKFT